MKRNSIAKIWKENKSLVVFIALMLVFRSAVADWNDVPTGSMKPTIVEGDRILVDKLAYDISVPFINHSLVKLADPQVNDIIIFESEVADKRLVKRVIGVPGDIVEMRNNQLTINNKQINYRVVHTEQTKRYLEEGIAGSIHKIQLTNQSTSYDNFKPVQVPKDVYLVLGDNRNQSADSRMIGFVPRKEVIGKSTKVILSLDYDNYFMPRSDRFFIDI